MKHPYLLPISFFLAFLLLSSCSEPIEYILENDFENAELADFVEQDFPFINTALDNSKLGARFPEDNQVPRALSVLLGHDAYVGFDTDLLRWSVAWQGDFVTMTGVAQVSYHNFFSKKDRFPTIMGKPDFATGTYPGWTSYRPDFKDVRNNNNENDPRNWGPIPTELGKWNGVYTHGDQAVLHYTIAGTEIHELPSSLAFDDEVAYTRTLRIKPISDSLFVVLAEFKDIEQIDIVDNQVIVRHQNSDDSLSIIALQGSKDQQAKLYVQDNCYIVMALPSTSKTQELTLAFWSGFKEKQNAFKQAVSSLSVKFPAFQKGGKPYWKEKVYTKGKLAPDTSAYVLDQLILPLPNPWKRNVRVADVAFFDNGKAAVATFDGDVWLLENINEDLDKLVWSRYASGIFEPMSILIKDDKIHVFGRDGITVLHDLNRDGVADYYENFSPHILQSMETREWASDMVVGDDGYFYIAKGGGTILNHTTAKDSPEAGYNAASAQGGSVLRISPNGEDLEVFATGFRIPYIGLHPQKGILTVSDQQGNFVPATPIYIAEKGDYFGVKSSAHRISAPRENELVEKRPLTWIPHNVDRSSISQLWLTSDKMGPLSQSMIHFSFGRTGLFTVLSDTVSKVKQGGVVFIEADYPAPVLKGAVHPKDGLLYIAGFNLWGSNSLGIAALTRLRYTGKPSYLPVGFRAGEQGVILSFSEKISKKDAENTKNFHLKRWNYERTPHYGSGHFLLNGQPGEERLPVLESHLSEDGKSVFLVIPAMAEVMQMQLRYSMKAEDGGAMEDIFSFSVHDVSPIDLSKSGFGKVKIDTSQLNMGEEERAALSAEDDGVSVEKGAVLFKQLACVGCHSTGTRTEGMYGTPFKNLYQSMREFKDGTSAVANEAYIRESIRQPKKKIVKGYGDEMPSYSGILSESDVESLILYIKTL